MLRMPQVKSLTPVALAGIFPVASVAIWLAYRAIATGLELGAVELLGLLVVAAISLTLGWLAVRRVTGPQQFLDARAHPEESVGKQQRQLDLALNHMKHGLCMFDSEGYIVLFNDRYCELMGERADYLRGLSLLDLFKHRRTTGAFSGDPDMFFSEVMEKLREGKSTVRERARADGTTLRIVNQPIQGGGWVATIEDITEQRNTERERDRNRAFLDLIIDNVPSTIFVKNAIDRKYILVNSAAERFWGLSREAIIGKTAEDVFPEAEAKIIKAREDELLHAGTALFDEREIQRPSDGKRNIVSKRLMLRDKDDAAQYLLGVIDDVTELKLAAARITHLAHYDPLTNLPNRTLFREQVVKELSLAKRGAQLALFYLDLDHFKSINDTFGHPVGDKLLKVVAERLRGCLRERDLIARFGGDEFVIVQAQIQGADDATAFAERLREAVTSTSYDLNGHQTTTDISVGIALAPRDGTDIDDLIAHADLALYDAKAEGRANHRYYEPGMDARIKQRRELEISLRSALANGELTLHYQPLVNLRTGAVIACEALLRWNHPQRGMIPPLEFIPIAEETGLISAIGEWVLRTACAEAMTWPRNVSIAVNVSPVQFRNPALALTVASILADSGLPASRLELEITESALMQNNDATLAALHQIRNLGVRISMDDFGTGYSSLSSLRCFPFDKIKIDRLFVSDLSKSDEAGAIVQAILSLALSLKMTTTAEGVETKEQQRLLQVSGCDEMQGYLFSPPRPANEIGKLLISHKAANKVA
jgi:diguanylate cyclase (GGDEF)-like protein/PAS domain S-box-containing protein